MWGLETLPQVGGGVYSSRDCQGRVTYRRRRRARVPRRRDRHGREREVLYPPVERKRPAEPGMLRALAVASDTLKVQAQEVARPGISRALAPYLLDCLGVKTELEHFGFLVLANTATFPNHKRV